MKRIFKVLGILTALIVSGLVLIQTVKAEGPTGTPNIFPWYGEVDGRKCGALFIRRTPNTFFQPLGWLVPGQLVQVVGREGDWLQIDQPGKGAPPRYIHGYYVKKAEIPPSLPFDPQKWIEIKIASQTLKAWEGEKLVKAVKVSTGALDWRFGFDARTPRGEFKIYYKLPVSRMVSTQPGDQYDYWSPWVMYFHGAYTIHGATWHNQFGTPRSHGCVNLKVPDAKWLYEWTPIGTRVYIH